MRGGLKRILIVLCLLNLALSFAVLAVPCTGDQCLPPVPGWGQAQCASDDYDGGRRLPLAFDTRSLKRHSSISTKVYGKQVFTIPPPACLWVQ